jgi:formimidoylglutamate deiminase
MTVFNPELAWIDGKFVSQKSITVEGGVISNIGEGDNSDKGAFLPGFVNAHSHAFQRGLRGRGETFASGGDTFWGWREEMYKLVGELSVDQFRGLCVQSFEEMRQAGITTVGEFHYFHHDQAADFAMDQAVLDAAKEVGIRIVLLHAFYKYGGPRKEALSRGQLRFSTQELESWWEQVDSLASTVDGTMQRIGTVAHSVRSVDIETIKEIATGALHRGMPMHIHLEEQRQEIESCIQKHGVTPMALLNDAIEVTPLLTAVHCTHSAQADMEQWLSSGGNVCLCPLTEASLADGVCDLHRIVKQGGCVSLGTDSNARISMLEEMRWMEYAQRLNREERGVCVDRHGSMANYLVGAATKNGARCLGIQGGEIAVGKLGDFTVIDLDHPQLAGCTTETLPASICCGADNAVILQTIISGM